jgi:hypothetical protein
MLSSKTFVAISCLLVGLFFSSAAVHAQEAGDNILSQTGVINNLSGSSPFVKLIPLRVPEIGKAYEVKINFLKVETSAAAVDAYIDYLNEQAKARGEAPGSAKWDALRAKLMQVVSKAEFEVLDTAGNLIGRASDLGTTTLFRTVKFTARSYDYQIRLRCASGAGVYHLTLEWD